MDMSHGTTLVTGDIEQDLKEARQGSHSPRGKEADSLSASVSEQRLHMEHSRTFINRPAATL